MWANAGCKARLTEKLLTRWLKDEATSVELTRVKEPVERNMVCNERFVFCSHKKGVVSVHAIASGDLVTELSSEPADTRRLRYSRVAINKDLDLVASVSIFMDGKNLGGTIWSVAQMEVVTHVSFTLPGLGLGVWTACGMV